MSEWGLWIVQDSYQWHASSRNSGFATFCHIGPKGGPAVALAVSDKDTGAHEVEANARLISAAPQLYEALQTFVTEYVALVNSGDAGSWDVEAEPKVIAARAALAKATGPMEAV